MNSDTLYSKTTADNDQDRVPCKWFAYPTEAGTANVPTLVRMIHNDEIGPIQHSTRESIQASRG
jgi:hypothetical protein